MNASFIFQDVMYPYRPKVPGRRKQYSETQIIHGMKLFYEGHTIRGAARKVGIPESTLRLRLKQGNKKMCFKFVINLFTDIKK